MSSVLLDGLRIRAADPGDASVLRVLAVRLTAFTLPPWRTPEDVASADAEAMIDAVAAQGIDNDVLIAEHQGVAVGCLHVLAMTDFFGRRHAHISVLVTAEAAEGSGVGRALIAHAEAWARSRALPLLTLNVFAANARARRVYEKAGFAPEILKYAKPL